MSTTRTPPTGRYDASSGKTLAVAIAEEIAAASGTEPAAPDLQLFDYIDPEALNSLHDHAATKGGATWELEFDVEDVTVTVSSDGRITVV